MGPLGGPLYIVLKCYNKALNSRLSHRSFVIGALANASDSSLLSSYFCRFLSLIKKRHTRIYALVVLGTSAALSMTMRIN
jgi:hypothetical protein